MRRGGRTARGRRLQAAPGLRAAASAALAVLALGSAAAAVDVAPLWDFDQPEASEQRFRQALGAAAGDDALVLRTQVVRALGLRGRYEEALAELAAVERVLDGAGAEPRVRAWLERGRVLRSSGQPAQGRPWFERAFAAAHAAGLQALAADALHMVALVEPTLEQQLAANRRVVDYARTSADPAARYWEGPAANNMGVALNEAGRHAEALPVFEQSLQAYRSAGRVGGARIARWQVAHTLRLLGRADESLAMQLALERDIAADAQAPPDPYVWEELALLYRARGDLERAADYERRRQALDKSR